METDPSPEPTAPRSGSGDYHRLIDELVSSVRAHRNVNYEYACSATSENILGPSEIGTVWDSLTPEQKEATYVIGRDGFIAGIATVLHYVTMYTLSDEDDGIILPRLPYGGDKDEDFRDRLNGDAWHHRANR